MRKQDVYNQYLDIEDPHPDLMYEVVQWSDIKDDFTAGPNKDDNGGLEYGVYWLDDNYEICDAEWFATDEERFNNIKLTNEQLHQEFSRKD